ncbi:hypothetical protein M422DRAFT_31634 [Sphaerobolus stellatus SS14]|uniref:Uncharacterized protein n=1 Tax=Sphaerobolus stellatus (strain SS14) TaxID=990650 RepID=A0A0C9VTI4_SPHS4|nr:hypothetical protein M422DRAFT_31634 [Sphaerobolus stellatus SS14]
MPTNKKLKGKARLSYALSHGTASMASFVSPVPSENNQEALEEEESIRPKINRWWKLPRRQSEEEKKFLPESEYVLDLQRQFQCAETRSILSEETAEDLDSEIVHIGSDWKEDDLDQIEDVDDEDTEYAKPCVYGFDHIQTATEKVRLYSL